MKLRDVKKMWSVSSNSLVVCYCPTRVQRRGQCGASLVEYAFVLILFLSMLFGISGFGHRSVCVPPSKQCSQRSHTIRGGSRSTCSDDSSCLASNSASGVGGPTTVADVEGVCRQHDSDEYRSSYITANMTVCGVTSTICSPAITTAPTACIPQPQRTNPAVRSK